MPAIQRRKASFKNSEGVELAALLELPPGTPTACALFAHCFTCGKDTTAASRISRALAVRGIAVMRFDFTGLGGSDGDFGNTNFSSNVTDLLAAAEFLRDNYLPPSHDVKCLDKPAYLAVRYRVFANFHHGCDF